MHFKIQKIFIFKLQFSSSSLWSHCVTGNCGACGARVTSPSSLAATHLLRRFPGRRPETYDLRDEFTFPGSILIQPSDARMYNEGSFWSLHLFLPSTLAISGSLPKSVSPPVMVDIIKANERLQQSELNKSSGYLP